MNAHHFHRPRWLTALLLSLTLMARIIVPSGFMVAPVAAGAAPMIVICTGQGAMTMALPMAGTPAKQHDQHDGKAADHPCAFAAASASVDLTAMLYPAAPVRISTESVAINPLAARPGLGLAAPPPPKTGPPYPLLTPRMAAAFAAPLLSVEWISHVSYPTSCAYPARLYRCCRPDAVDARAGS